MENDKIGANLDKIAAHLEKANFGEYAELLLRPWKLMWINFMAGLFRGLGMAVGMTVVFAVVIYVLASVLSNFIQVPIIGKFIADLVDFVNSTAKTNIKY